MVNDTGFNLRQFPTLKIGDITLRELRLDDAKDYLSYITDPEVAGFISDCDLPSNLAEAESELNYWRQLFLKDMAIYWGVALSSSDKLIGTCGFNHINFYHGRGEISYDLSKEYWHKGIMKTALEEICGFAFEVIALNRIQATTEVNNDSSRFLLEKLGFMEEGVLRNYGKLNGQQRNYYIYSLIKED
jgi:ribosomal-protein-alanine N-acetyltransferase